MTAMMSPPTGSHFLTNTSSVAGSSRTGILLNGTSSVPNSPKRIYLTPYSSSRPSSSHAHNAACGPSSLSSHSSSASSTSSSDDIATSSATEATIPPSSSSGRKIRFAPLPDPRRDVLVAEDGSELPVPNDDAYLDSERILHAHTADGGCLCHANGSTLTSPLTSPCIHPATPTNASYSLYSPMSNTTPGASCSTLGLSVDGSSPLEGLDSGQNTETNTIIASATSSLKDMNMGRASKTPKWRRIFSTLKPSSSNLSCDGPSPMSLFRSNSRESTASNFSGRGSVSDSWSDGASMRHFAARRTNSVASADGAVQRAQFRGGFSLKHVISEAGTSSTASSTQKKARPLPAASVNGSRRGTRLLNGRVYGVKQSAALAEQMRTNPFGNARDDEPEFVEWGHGGMGSVRSGAVVDAKSDYSRLQSNKKLSVGAVDSEGNAVGADEEDDGSGMAWLKRRKAQREKEKREAEEREKVEREGKEKENVDGDAKESKDGEQIKDEQAISAPPDIRISAASPEPVKAETAAEAVVEVPGPVEPKDASEEKEVRQLDTIVEVKEAEKEKEGEKAKGKEQEHVYTAVTLPPKAHNHSHRPHHAHSNSHSSMATVGSLTPTQEHVKSVAAPGVSPLSRTTETDSTRSDTSGSTSDEEDNGEKDADEDDAAKKDADEEEEEDEDEDEEQERARVQAMAAGVEKVSKHKD